MKYGRYYKKDEKIKISTSVLVGPHGSVVG
jgi:hypothetical protein